MRGQHTWNEIQSQSDVWAAALRHAGEAAPGIVDAFPLADYSEALFIGCGSTHYLSQTAAALCNQLTGVRSRGLPSSEAFLFPTASLPRGGRPLLVAVSRSGETTETIIAARALRENLGAPTITVGNYPDSTLVRECDAAIIVPEGREQSVAQTRSFTSMLVSLQVLLGTAAGATHYLDSLAALPEAVSGLLSGQSEAMRQLGDDPAYDTFIFLGSGPFYGLACEAMLKMKEMSLSHSEAFHHMEFRHGPKSIVTNRTLIAAILSDSARDQELRVLSEMRDLGATVLLIADRAPSPCPADHLIELGTGLPETARLPLVLPPLQVLAYSRAMAKGLNPDRPTNLDSVVVLEE